MVSCVCVCPRLLIHQTQVNGEKHPNQAKFQAHVNVIFLLQSISTIAGTLSKARRKPP